MSLWKWNPDDDAIDADSWAKYEKWLQENPIPIPTDEDRAKARAVYEALRPVVDAFYPLAVTRG